jgi:hypothetical protein
MSCFPNPSLTLGALCCVVIIALACDKPFKTGSPCPSEVTPGMAFCFDSSSALTCTAEKKFANATTPCKGKKGCFGNKPGKLADICDFSGDETGDYCVEAEALECDTTTRTCSADGRSMVACSCSKPGKFEVIACRGPKACSVSAAGLAECDHSIVKADDPCDPAVDDHKYACSEDRLLMYVCPPAAKKWVPARSCRGPKHCVQKGQAADCDAMLSQIGDPCDVQGLMGCTVDRGSATICKNGAFMEVATCHAPSFCQATPVENVYRVDCDGLTPEQQKKLEALQAPKPAPPPEGATGAVADGGAGR